MLALTIAAVAALVSAALPAQPASAVPSGTAERKILVLPVHWDAGNGSPAAPPLQTASELLSSVFHNQAWYSEISYGQFPGWHVTGLSEPDGNGITIDPPQMDAGGVCASVFEDGLATKANAKAVAAGRDLSSYNAILYYFSPVPNCPWSGLSSGNRIWINGRSDNAVFHELGHQLFVSHGNALTCTDAAGATVALSTTCTTIGYGDRNQVMGTGPGGFAAIQRYDAGWMNGRMAEVGMGGGTYTIQPLEATMLGLQALRVTDRNFTLWVEYRQRIGIDSTIPAPGVLVYQQVPNVGLGSFLLDMTPKSAGAFFDAALPVGATIAIPGGTLQITVNAAGPDGAQISITPVRVTVPNIVGLGYTAARGALLNVGLDLGNQRDVTVNACGDSIGTVLNQSPGAGESVPPGTLVNYDFGVKPTGTFHCQ